MTAVFPSPDGRSPGRRPPTGGPVAPQPRSAVVAPPTRQRVRRTRLWMVLLLLTPVCLAVISLLTFATDGPPEPVVQPVSTPPGYTAVTDAYYGYAVPAGYTQNPTWTDQNADFLYGSASRFVAETLLIAKTSPTARTAPPASFASFGEPTTVPFSVSGGHPVRVPGTAFAYEVDITRPGGFRAVAVDTWLPASTTQMWLLVRAPPAVTATVVGSLRGG